MPKSEKDERKVTINGDRILVERINIESFDAEEWLRITARQENELNIMREQLKLGEKMLKMLNEKKKEVQEIRKKEIEKAKKDIEAASAKENANKNPK